MQIEFNSPNDGRGPEPGSYVSTNVHDEQEWAEALFHSDLQPEDLRRPTTNQLARLSSDDIERCQAAGRHRSVRRILRTIAHRS